MGLVSQFLLGIAAAVFICFTLLLIGWMRGVVPRRALSRWFRELGLMLKHRVPLVVALEACADRAPTRLSRLSFRFREMVRDGECLSNAFDRTLALPRPVLAMITAGEVFGTLPDALIDAADLLLLKGRGPIGPNKRKLPEEDLEQENLINEAAAGSPIGNLDLLARNGEDAAPIVRVAQSIFAQAIQSGAESIEFEPVRTQKPPRHHELQDEEEWKLLDMQIGPQLLVTFGRGDDRWEAMRVPMYLAAPLYRRIKIMADIPYWQKPPVSGHMNIRFGEQDYDIYLDSDSHPLGERLRLQIVVMEL